MEHLTELLPFIDVVGKEAVCRVEIIPLQAGRRAVICEELDDNPGQSVTESWEAVVVKVCRTYGLTPQSVVWIEHNQEQIKVGGRLIGRYQLVTFKLPATGKAVGTPEWRNMTPDDWIELGLTPRE